MIPTSSITLLLTLILSVKGWETEQQAASQLVDLISSPKTFGVTTLSTLYPQDHPDESLRGQIASGAEYYAGGCFEGSADLLMLGMPVSQNWRNVLPPSSNSNLTLSINSNPDPSIPDPRHLSKRSSHSWDPERASWRRGMPSKIRTQLMGSVEVLNEAQFKQGLGWIEVSPSQMETSEAAPSKTQASRQSSVFQRVFENLNWLLTLQYNSNLLSEQHQIEQKTYAQVLQASSPDQHSKLSKCYLDSHPDSSHWTPGSDDSDSPHTAMWVRIRIEKIYSVGGFGDEHRIGWVSKQAWEEAWMRNRDL